MAGKTTVSREFLALLFGLSVRRVQQLVEKRVIPDAVTHGEYDMASCVQAYIQHLRGRIAQGGDTMAKQKVRILKARADSAELERAKLQGKLVPAVEVGDAWRALVAVIRQNLLTVPTKVAALLGMARSASEAQQILKTAINEALEGLNRFDLSAIVEASADVTASAASLADTGDAEDADDDPATADLDSEPVG